MNTPIIKYARAKQASRRLLFLFTLLATIAAGVHAQNDNVLSVPDFSGQADKTVYVPVYLDNADEIVSAQFEVVLPFDMPEGSTAQPSNRLDGHSISIYARGNHVYRVVLMSMENKALRGNSGLLMRLPMVPTDDLTTDNTSYPVVLQKVVLANARGKNLATELQSETTFTIDRGELPDLSVPSVEPATTTANPGGQVSISYTVANEGNGDTKAGWTERFYLESALTGTRIFLGSKQHQGTTLAAGSSVQQTANFQLAQLPHADGPQVVVLQIEPAEGMGELLSAQGNNEGRSQGVLNLGKQLSLYYDKTTLRESHPWNFDDYITLSLQRSGDWTLAETLLVTCDVDGLLTLDGNTLYGHAQPTTVKIPARQASVTLRLRSVNDDIRRALRATVTITPQNANSGYEAQTLTVTRTEDDQDPLSLSASVQSLTEGQLLTLTATRGGELADDAELTVSSSQPGRFAPGPYAISIPKGQRSGSVTIESTDDDAVQLDCTATFTAQATGYKNATAQVSLADNDRPQITLSVAPATVCENAGAQAAMATITRDRGLSQPVTLWLSSSNTQTAWFATQQVRIAAGERQVQVPVAVSDNAAVDGSRTCTLSAALYVMAAGQVVSTTDRAYSSARLIVTDDETPYLSLSPATATRSEGSQVSFTLTRHVASASQAQTVQLSASEPDGVSMPTTVTFAAGSTQTSFSVALKRNTTENDDRDISIEAEASGLSGAQAVISVTDRTLPDAVVTAVGTTTPTLYAGMDATLTATLGNTGTAELPAGVLVDFYLCTQSQLGRSATSTLIATVPTTEAIAIDGQLSVSCTTPLPDRVGTYYLYARVNGDGAVSEFSTSNNLPARFSAVTIAAPFALKDLSTDRDTYLPGDEIRVKGRVESLLPGGLQGHNVSLTLSGNGQASTSQQVTIDELDGTFEAYLRISATATGWLTVSARAVGQTEASLQQRVGVYAIHLSVASGNNVKVVATKGETKTLTGSLRLRNNSAQGVTGISLTQPTTLPAGSQLVLATPSQALNADQYLNIDYTLTLTDAVQPGSHTIGFVAETAEGARSTAQLGFSYAQQEPSMVIPVDSTSNLGFTDKGINTTLLVGSTRDLWLKIANQGELESGTVEVSTSGGQWLQSLTASPLPSVQGKGTAWIHLQFTHLEGMHSGQVFTGQVSINPQNGSACVLPVKITVVGTEWSKLDVAATDVYSLVNQDYSRISGTKVSISDAATGREVLTGITQADGHWHTDQIAQGTYTVTLTAPRHKSVSRTLVMGPAEEQTMEFYLPYKAVLTNFVVDQSLEDGSYTMRSEIDVDQKAPQGIVLAELPEEGFGCGTEEVDVKLTNVGPMEATGVQLVLPQVDGVSFTLAGDTPLTLAPNGGTGVVRVVYEGGDEGRARRIIGKSLLRYYFNVDGQLRSEDDVYQSLVGCQVSSGEPEPLPEPGPNPNLPDETGDDDDGDGHYGHTTNEATPEDFSPYFPLPTDGSYYTFLFDDEELNHVVVGQPLHATLVVKNGQEGNFHRLSFIPNIIDKDTETVDQNDNFILEQGELTNFEPENTGLLLPGHTEGIMRLTLTALPEAVPSTAEDGSFTYLVGGVLSYYNAGSEIAYTQATVKYQVTVNGRGELTVTPIVQRTFPGQGDIAQMALMVQNTGTVGVNSLSLNSQQPVVRDLTTFLPISYSMKAQQLPNETSGDFSSLKVNRINGGETLTSRWLYQSEQAGRVDGFDRLSEGFRSTAAADCDLTMAGVRELFRTVQNPATSEAAENEAEQELAELLAPADVMLLVENEREVAVPDRVLYSDGTDGGTIADVSTTATTTGAGSDYTLTVAAEEGGWVYGSLHDPTNGLMILQKVTRQSDGKVVSLANFWQTSRTLQSDFTYVEENQLHFADLIGSEGETYQLHYEPRPDGDIELMNVRLYTASGTEVAPGDTVTERVTKAIIDFTGGIYQSLKKTVLQLTARNAAWNNVNNLAISAVGTEKNVWQLDFTGMDAVPGKHALTLLVSQIRIARSTYIEGDDITVEWTEQLDGTAHIDLAVAPNEDYGSIDQESGDYSYGEHIFTATPAEGYQFDYWSIDGKKQADSQPELAYEVWSNASLRAHFSARRCQITAQVNNEAWGELSRGTLGTVPYDWGQELVLSARAKSGYEFECWLLDGEKIEDAAWSMTIRVTDDATYTAVFRKKFVPGDVLADQRGWIYQLNDDMASVTLVDATKAAQLPAGEVVVPAATMLREREYPVTGIGSIQNDPESYGAFYGCKEMTSLTLEGKQALTLDDRAFQGCYALTEICVDYVTMKDYLADENLSSELEPLLMPFIEPVKELTTFACAVGIDFTKTEGVTAYAVTRYNHAERYVAMNEVDEAPAAEGLVLRSEGGGKRYRLQRSDVASEPAVNMLVGAVESVSLTTVNGDYTNFLLSDGAFGKSGNGQLPAGKAYLPVPTSVLGDDPNGVRSISMHFDEEASAIKNVTAQEQRHGWFTLDGRRLDSRPVRKGVYMQGGQKVTIK